MLATVEQAGKRANHRPNRDPGGGKPGPRLASDYSLHCLAVLVAGGSLDEDVAAKVEACDRPILEFLGRLDPEGGARQTAFEGVLAGRPDADRIRAALEGIDPKADPPEPGEKPEITVGVDFRVLTAAELAGKQFDREYLVEGVLVARQPGIIGGPFKALKSSIGLGLGLSLASGRDFLGEFAVPSPKRSLFLSGELEEAVVQETAARIAESMGTSLEEIGDSFQVGFRLPILSKPEEVKALALQIRRSRAEVVIIDPAYLCVTGGSTAISEASMFQMGPLLESLGRACLDEGATPFVIHHFKQNLDRPHKAPELADLAYAGFAQYARQWLLLNRSAAFKPGSGRHELVMVYGGSAGHSGSWKLDIHEGAADETSEGRRWEVYLSPTDSAARGGGPREQAEPSGPTAKERRAQKVVDILTAERRPMSQTEIKKAASLSGNNAKEAIGIAKVKGWIKATHDPDPTAGGGASSKAERFIISASADSPSRDGNHNQDKEGEGQDKPPYKGGALSCPTVPPQGQGGQRGDFAVPVPLSPPCAGVA